MYYNKSEILDIFSDTFLSSLEEFYDKRIQELLREMKYSNYSYDYGVSKFVIIPMNKDYVIKIPFTGQEKVYKGFVEFNGAEYEERPWDYCAAEVSRYTQACLNGMEKYFAETKMVGFIKGFPIYIQQKADVFDSSLEEDNSFYSEEEINKTLQSLKGKIEYPSININWLTDFRLCYGEEELTSFLDFLRREDWSDFHTQNIGYIDGAPVIIDYSSFEE